MNSFLEAVQQFLLTTTAAVTTAVSIIYPINQGTPQSQATPQPTTQAATESVVELITASGQYSYLNQHIKYTVTIPKTGGEVKGSFEGPCQGDITGNYDGQAIGSIKGSLQGKCKLGFIEQEIKGQYSGTVNQPESKVDLNWANDGTYGPKQGTLTLDIQNSSH